MQRSLGFRKDLYWNLSYFLLFVTNSYANLSSYGLCFGHDLKTFNSINVTTNKLGLNSSKQEEFSFRSTYRNENCRSIEILWFHCQKFVAISLTSNDWILLLLERIKNTAVLWGIQIMNVLPERLKKCIENCSNS